MTEEASLEFRFIKIDEKRNYSLEEIKHNNLMSENYEKTCKYLNNDEHLLNLASKVTGCDSVPEFASLVLVPIRIKNSAVGLKLCTIIVGVKNYK